MQRNDNTIKRVDASALHVAIVAARFNEPITNALITGAMKELALNKVAKKNITLVTVPGSVELPLNLKMLARTKKYDALVAIGAIIKGDTPHFYYVSSMASQGIMMTSLQENIPIGFGILTTNDEAQARVRTDFGASAVRAALEGAMHKKEILPARASGVVVGGEKMATKLGFPTINIAYDGVADLPHRGVYAGRLTVGSERYPGAISLGAVKTGALPKLEIHCFEQVAVEANDAVSLEFLKRVSDFIIDPKMNMKQKIASDVRKIKKFFAIK